MRISKQAAGIAGSVGAVVLIGGGIGAYAAVSGSDSPTPAPAPAPTVQQHVVAPAADPVIPNFDDLPASTSAAPSTPAPSPTSTAPTVGQSSTSVSQPKETTVPDQPKTSEPKTDPTTSAYVPTPHPGGAANPNRPGRDGKPAGSMAGHNGGTDAPSE